MEEFLKVLFFFKGLKEFPKELQYEHSVEDLTGIPEQLLENIIYRNFGRISRGVFEKKKLCRVYGKSRKISGGIFEKNIIWISGKKIYEEFPVNFLKKFRSNIRAP